MTQMACSVVIFKKTEGCWTLLGVEIRVASRSIFWTLRVKSLLREMIKMSQSTSEGNRVKVAVGRDRVRWEQIIIKRIK